MDDDLCMIYAPGGIMHNLYAIPHYLPRYFRVTDLITRLTKLSFQVLNRISKPKLSL